MTVDLRPKSTGETLQELATRLYRVEQESSRPSGAPASGGMTGNPAVDTITIGGIVVGSDASPVTGLTLETGSFMDDIWIDVDWMAPFDGTAASYDVELARKIGSSYELVQVYHTGGTGLRMSALWPQMTYGVRVTAINRIDARSDPTPAIGFMDITTGIDATVPGQVTGLTVTSGLRSFLVKWNEVTDRDVARGTGQYQLQWALDIAFSTTLGDVYTTSTVESVLFETPTTSTIYFRVRAIDNSGNAGSWSSTASNTLGLVVTNDLTAASITTGKLANLAVDNAKLADLAVDAAKLSDSSVTSTKIANLAVGSAAIAALAVGSAQIADAAIVSAKIGNLAVTTASIADLAVTNGKIGNLSVDNAKISDLDAAKITAGTISADRIAANSIDVNKLTTSTLTSKTITLGAGGTLKIGNAPTTGILINDQGIRLYSGGSIKVALDVAGTASFEGNISASSIASSTLTSATINSGTITGATVRTASSGERIALEAGVQDQLRFYTGNASESVPGKVSVGSGTDNLNVDLTAPRVSGQNYGTIQLSTRTGNTVPAIAELSIRDPSANIVQSLRIIGSTASIPGYLYFGNGVKFELGQFPGSTGLIRLVGSGDYGFLYLQGGGAAATLNVNYGLGAGFHVLDGTNGSFHPIQASAFNVSSARDVKENVREETQSSLARLEKIKVMRFHRVYANKMEKPPPHVQREYDLEEVGLMADELISVVPEAVLTNDAGKARSVNLSILVSLLIKAVQELSERSKKINA